MNKRKWKAAVEGGIAKGSRDRDDDDDDVDDEMA